MSNSELRNVGLKNIIVSIAEDGTYTPSFIYNNSGNAINIPVPDMSLVYLRLAYTNFKDTVIAKTELFKKDQTTRVSLEETFRYIGVATVGVVNLYNSIESFCNQIIPQEIKYPKKGKKELVYKEVTNLPTSEKIKEVLPFCLRKHFRNYHENAYCYLLDKIKVRNQIVHLSYNGIIDDQVFLFQKLLDIEYDKLYDSAVKLFNFYRNDHVKDCPCSNDF